MYMYIIIICTNHLMHDIDSLVFVHTCFAHVWSLRQCIVRIRKAPTTISLNSIG